MSVRFANPRFCGLFPNMMQQSPPFQDSLCLLVWDVGYVEEEKPGLGKVRGEGAGGGGVGGANEMRVRARISCVGCDTA